MPVNKIFIICLILCGATALKYHLFTDANSKALLHPISQSEFSGHGVIDRVIQLKFIKASPSKVESDPTTIKVAITLPFDFDQELQFKWLLTENIRLKSGNLSGKILHFKAGVSQEIEIEVTGFSEAENRHIAFQIAGLKDGRKIFADGIVASLKENTFENIVQNVEKIKAEKKLE